MKEFLDSETLFNRFVVFEGEFRNPPKVVKAFAERASNKAGRRFQSLQGFLAILFSPECGDINSRVAEIAGSLDVSNGGEPDAWIMDFPFENLAYFDP